MSESAGRSREPRPLPGAVGRILAGNPFQDEGVAFRWLIAVLLAAVTVVIAAKAISGVVAVIWGILLLGIFGYAAVRVLIYLISSPDDEE
ncbi:MAG: hypothetical protein M9938_07515 [Solirubrobacterales bacterium]|nr:hypothetical protein [Solirubrobacterales bacterium]